MASRPHSGCLIDTQTTTPPSTTPSEDINSRHAKSSTIRQGTDGLRRWWCYSLHALLLILHLVLLAMLWLHPEHRLTLSFDNSVLTVGLSAFLQAFYTLYTALLVFITQRLALSVSLSRLQKLTTTHDISAAWNGLGAAILTLWQQTKIPASTCATTLVFLYLACVTVLHVASSTIMQFQPYNASLETVIAANSTWPDSSINLTALEWGGIAPVVTVLGNLNPTMLSTPGLVNSTLYDVFTESPSVVNATVNATTVLADCGLLPIISSSTEGSVDVSLGQIGIANVSIYEPWKDEMMLSFSALCSNGTCAGLPLLFMVSTAIEVDSSVQTPVSVNTPWIFTPTDGGATETSNTTVHLVACSLYVSSNETMLDEQNSTLLPFVEQPDTLSQRWSLWSPNNNSYSETLDGLIYDVWYDVNYPGPLLFCDQSVCPPLSILDIYLMSLIGVNATANSIISTSESSANPSVTLSPSQMEAAVSQFLAQLIWLAGQFGESNGGFTLSPTSASVTQEVLKWRLNINEIPVVCAFCASFAMLTIVFFAIGGPARTKTASISSITVLEMLWIGAHTHDLRKKFFGADSSSEAMRSIGMFDICLGDLQGSGLKSRLGENVRNEGSSLDQQRSPRPFDLEEDVDTRRPDADRAHNDEQQCGESLERQSHKVTAPTRRSFQFWGCYLLHGVFVMLHLALIVVFTRHAEHAIVIPLNSTAITIGLAALLQLFYTIYTTILVFMTQRLALRRIMTSRRNLNRIHDNSRAWAGIGSAMVSISQQRNFKFWATFCIMFQSINRTVVNMAQSTLAWPNSSVALEGLDWTNMLPLVPAINQLPDLSRKGLISNTVYDTVAATPSSLSAVVNVTTVHADCGLVSGLSLNNSDGILTSSTLLNSTTIPLAAGWNNSVTFVNPSYCNNGSACDDYLFFFTTTSMDIDAESLAPGSSISVVSNDSQVVANAYLTNYLVACSLSAATVLDTLDLQTNSLSGLNSTQPDTQQWTLFTPTTNTSDLNIGISTAISDSQLASQCPTEPGSGYDTASCDMTYMEIYIMEILGINVAESVITTGNGTAPTIILGRSQFENTISEVATQLIWLAGRMPGGFGPAYGTSQVTDSIVELQLNINIIPLSLALGASVTLLLLTFYLVGVTPTRALAVSSLGVLETLWVESHSQLLHDCMMEIDDPSMDNLRRAGMVKVCLADEFATAGSTRGWGDSQPLTMDGD